MENADVWFAVIVAAAVTVVLVALAVEATIAVKKGTHGCDLPVTAEDKSHGCDLPVDFKDAAKEEEEYLSSLWGLGVCRSCRKEKEVYLPYTECARCLWHENFGPETDEVAELEAEYQSMKMRAEKLDTEVNALRKRIQFLEDQVKWLGSNAFGD